MSKVNAAAKRWEKLKYEHAEEDRLEYEQEVANGVWKWLNYLCHKQAVGYSFLLLLLSPVQWRNWLILPL